MTQKLDSSKKSGEEILQTIEPEGIADESMRRTVEIWLFVTWYGSIGGHKLTKSLPGKRLN
ncbi:hypothetical protein BH695_2883 [Microcystis aeruginosa PCC 7806SL]|uniref:Uncharacterized protein n=1 Tax=Microcystis aeruginosa PCC 7806SL TaxID=1903187 RepID=A0AB33BPT9_MICA7|nr:hypothetical protein BH695_2883 [Microcystis aeruginosa PCC 7806SL]TRU05207.1 MAG: hypothetical protein EWV61_05095 [Microcystis aeruginosa Ma_AC_P_19900807_S300]